MVNRRAKTIAHYQFPTDWTPAEIQVWLEVAKRVQQAKDELKTIVFVTGVFDLLHQEHINFLRKARNVGNYLVVGVETDLRVKESKGPDRPINSQNQRVQDVISTEVVDDVAILPRAFDRPEHHRAILSVLRPHVLAVSSHTPYLEAKRQMIQLFGGELKIVHEHNPQVSTTLSLQELPQLE